jgi:hypothetical protein
MNRLLFSTLFLASIMLLRVTSAMAADESLPACIQYISDFNCFQENRDRIYQIDNKLFWKHWLHHEALAKACTSRKATARFISLVIGSDGELGEAIAKFIENLILNNVGCFLAAAETLDDHVVNHLIRYYVMTPTYHEPSETLPLIERELKRKGYPRFKKLYFEIKKTKS